MSEPLLSVGSLHALAYCERLFYLEEVERIRIADASVFAGRTLHAEREGDPVDGELVEQSFQSDELGLIGRIDVLRRKPGTLVPYERKRGRAARRASDGGAEAWRTDRIQVGAYAMIVEEAYGEPITEALVRYHADHATVSVPIDASLRAEVTAAIARARVLRVSRERPPVTDDERRCVHCSLAPVCLPEEGRAANDPTREPLRLFPAHVDRTTVHVVELGAQVGRSGDELVIWSGPAKRNGTKAGSKRRMPIGMVGTLVLHGYAQVSTQALRLCAEHDVAVHWMTMGGSLIASLAPTAQSAQRHLRQFAALSSDSFSLTLARRLIGTKVESQLRFLLRATRGAERSPLVAESVERIRRALGQTHRAESREALLGFEGTAAAAYFSSFSSLLTPDRDPLFSFEGRTRRPPRDRVNALLGYAYGMLYREVLGAIVAVGLHPGVGFCHQPRSAAHTLALDLMEIFRVPLVDMAIVAALNRRTFDAVADFVTAPGEVLLSASGRRKTIEVFERRKEDLWRHTAVKYSLSYARLIELEVRLLEKEWTGEPGLFASFRLR